MTIRALIVACAAASVCVAQPCARCHQAESAHFADATMTRALEPAQNSGILRRNPKLTAAIGGVSYEIDRIDSVVQYSVTDGNSTLRYPLKWAFGQGSAGQTYLYEQEGRWYESRVSFFSATGGLDLTMGAQNITPHNLAEAAGRLLPPREATDCFHCHATSASQPGIQCERCHGPSEAHLKSNAKMAAMRSLSTEELSEFCGQCHRTWSQIASDGPRGIQNVRFQPYRLGSSKCYDTADSRIRCTACHDPHAPLKIAAASYDAKCLACHSRNASPATKASSHICPKSTKDCTTCHMPRLDLPGAHKKFTDHLIRIAMPNERYPE